MYDARLGRFLSVDPMTDQFAWWTPYQFAGNSPIWAKDLDGDEGDEPTDPNCVAPTVQTSSIGDGGSLTTAISGGGVTTDNTTTSGNAGSGPHASSADDPDLYTKQGRSMFYNIDGSHASTTLNEIVEPSHKKGEQTKDASNSKPAIPINHQATPINHKARFTDIDLGGGNTVTVNFQSTKDGVNSDRPVNSALVTAVTGIVTTANNTTPIHSILITATTNGQHSNKNSNHFKGNAVDIGAINGERVQPGSATALAMQDAAEVQDGVRENFGPAMMKKNRTNFINSSLTPKQKAAREKVQHEHQTHLHFSVN